MRLSIKELSFTYGESPILQDISMDLGRSEILGIVGPNGSGKSTLIRCIDRILKPQQGRILLDRMALKSMKQMEIARRLGYVPQNAPRTFPVTVFDAVLMGRRPHLGWQSGEKDRETVVAALKRLDIEDLALRDFNELSGGEQQRVLIARALAQEADVLLLDEPTSNLDIRHQLEVMEIMRSLVTEKGLSAIIAIHDLNLASRYTDRVVMMSSGKVFATGDPVSVFTPENIAHVYGVESLVRQDNGTLYILPQRPVHHNGKPNQGRSVTVKQKKKGNIMSEIKTIGTMSLIENIKDLKYYPTGGEGDVAPLIFGDHLTSHAMTIPPGFYPPHAHPMELLLVCMKGRCDIFQGDGKIRGKMGPMSVALIPADEEIGQEIHGPEPCELVVVVAPKRTTREAFIARFDKKK